MAHDRSDADLIAHTHNTARFFVENRHVAWVLLVAAIAWGVFGYIEMPKRRDPDVPAVVAVAICPWPGASAERIEQLVTRKLEERIAGDPKLERIESISRSNVAILYLHLEQRIADTGPAWDDLHLKLNSINDLPAGAGPIQFLKDFGDTSALMLAVASPKADPVLVSLRARAVQRAIRAVRSGTQGTEPRASMIVCFPESIPPDVPRRQRDAIGAALATNRIGHDLRPIDGPGFVGLDLATGLDDRGLLAALQDALERRIHVSEFHPDMWAPVVIRDPATAAARLAAVAGDKYSYRELDDYSDLIQRTLQNVPQVAKISRTGLLRQAIYLEYSQEQLAGLENRLPEILGARNITLPGGVLEVAGKNLAIDPSGEFKSAKDIGDVIVGTTESGRPIYLRDNVNILRGYENPPTFLNFFSSHDQKGRWRRSRAITLGIDMRPGQQIADFGAAVDAALAGLKQRLPEDLILDRISDQPRQVRESIDLFSTSLEEAIVLVVLVALVGFWEWRSAALIALSIPLTLALTLGGMHLLRLDVQQVSLSSLILALGLLVDDPVVAGDAIKRELDAGHPPGVASWLGPTKLANAIMFATITNMVAYLPLLLIGGDTGRFLYSLPVVLACALVMSRLVSMSFIPSLSFYLLRPSPRKRRTREDLRQTGFNWRYSRVAGWALDHRWLALGASVVLLAAGLLSARTLTQNFFPSDLQYLSYVDVWLPEDATLSATNQATQQAEAVIQDVAARYGREHPGEDGKPRRVIESLSAFVGGGGPRFWLSVFPELPQTNYAQIIVKVDEKHDTAALVPELQRALSAGVPGARLDVRQLETGKAVGIPVQLRLSGPDTGTLRRLAGDLEATLRVIPTAARVRDDWGAKSFSATLQVESDRANFAGVSNRDVALSSAIGLNGLQVTTLHDGDKEIPVIARLRPEERARLSDIRNLYVYSTTSATKVPLGQISTITYRMKNEQLRRRNQFSTITVSCFPVPGALSSQVMDAVRPKLAAFQGTLPPGYRLEIGGEEEEATRGFQELSVVMMISIAAIFLALVFQFRNAVKPLIVFSAIPFGVAGSLVALVVMKTPFGFMAFLGVVSLIGVIVSHVIVLFDFIEEAHANGEPLRDALIDAGILRLRPVLITVGATVFGLVPLALHGGPLWQPLCYVQIGGLTVATFVTLLLVPVLYAIFVLDLKIVTWERAARTQPLPVAGPELPA
ncbi:MAG TPA: efflux RND transporter permease subunit [Vicinamibacterales bacterium]|nr:efflux RND transporter permease subunit [Vicinamibacterales bacterium]